MLNNSLTSIHKGVGLGNDPRQWNLLDEDINLPAAVLLEENMTHNLRWMQNFIDKYRVKLAPHGKTTMSPQLFLKQIEHGAWGMTVATVHQVQIAFNSGIRRIIMANQLIGKTNMKIIRQLINDDPDFEFYCLIDSVKNVEELGRFFHTTEHTRPLQVLLEIGMEQGRTGIRNEQDEKEILDVLRQYHRSIQLAGIELFEGVTSDETAIRSILQRAVNCVERLSNTNQFARSSPILSGAGSSWYDIVAEEFSKVQCSVEIILRPGCYLTHDAGTYRKAQNRILEQNSIAREISGEGGLKPALQIWAYVQSIPEKDRAIIAFGKRDAAFDAGYPIPVLHYRSEWSKPKEIDSNHYQIFNMMDQHAFLRCPSDHDLLVGDILAFDISHPCLTCDKWRKILLVNRDYRVIDVFDTYF